MSKKPHIVILNPDQWRGDVMGHLGNPGAVTPHIDRLVETDAVSFSNAYCQNPVCTPSRCSFMTGWYPHTRGHRTMFHMLQPHEPMLLRTLKEQGYFVWWGGKNDVVAAQYGYAAYCDIKYDAPDTLERPLRTNLHFYNDWRGEPDSDTYYSFHYGKYPNDSDDDFVYDFDQAMIEGAIETIRHHPTDQPLCLYLPIRHPHPPYIVEAPWYTRIDPAGLPPRIPAPEDWADKPSILAGLHTLQNMQGWTEERWQDLRRTYYGMCARVDAQLGLLIDALQKAGLYDETALFVFSDHGDFTGDYGLVEKTQNTFEDCLARVPFIIKPPADVSLQPGVRDALVELVDFPATVEALTGIAPQHTHFGRSLLPLITGETETHRDAVFCQGGRLYGETHAMERESNGEPDALYYPRMAMQRSEGSEHTKATMVRTQYYKYVHRLYEKNELYDLQADPAELHNRIDDPALASVQHSLEQRLMSFYLETSDVVPLTPDQRD